MVDYQRQMLDELMGRNRNLDPGQKAKAKTWKDHDNCKFFMYSFCPHDLFVNTRADLGPCTKLHDEETKQQYNDATRCARKTDIENEFIRFILSMITEVDRKIVKGKQRLDLMNSKLDQRPMSKQAEAVLNINDKITKLVREAEEAGTRGDVDQAQNLMGLCEKLKEDKEALIKQYESCGFNFSETQEKQMEVCETCGAFLIVGDAQSRIDDHLMGKQHIGYTRLRKALEDHKKNPQKELEDTRRSGSNTSRRERRDSRDRDRDRDRKDDRRDDRSRYRDDRDRNKRDRSDRDRKDRDRSDRDRKEKERDSRRRKDRRSKSKSRDRRRRRSRS